MKWRNSKERELLASGGSREQTLPTKNNPNPDLSDVKEDSMSGPQGINDPLKSSDEVITAKDALFSPSGPVGSLEILTQSHEAKMDALLHGVTSPSRGQAKLQVKDVASMGAPPPNCHAAFEGTHGYSFSFATGGNDSEYTDEDINVTDELTGSNNEESDEE